MCSYTITSISTFLLVGQKLQNFQNLKCYLHENKILIGVSFIKKYQNLVTSKTQNNIVVAEKIGCGNNIVSNKIGQVH